MSNQLAIRMKRFWETTTERNAHLGLSGEREFLLERCKKLVADRVTLKNRTVIDFGCGGGLLGAYLLANCGIKRYIAYDIAERSIAMARTNTVGYDNVELNLLREHRWNFAEKKPDVIVCLACIIHFPHKVYLDNFLLTCNDSGARVLVLEIRDVGKGTVFQRDPYTDVRRTILACNTNADYVSNALTNYRLVEKTDPKEHKTNCQVLWYKRNA